MENYALYNAKAITYEYKVLLLKCVYAQQIYRVFHYAYFLYKLILSIVLTIEVLLRRGMYLSNNTNQVANYVTTS